MKKLTLVTILMLLLVALLLPGCAAPTPPAAPAETPAETPVETPAEPSTEPVSVRVGALKGPTAMGMVKMMDDSEAPVAATGNLYEFTIASAVDEIPPAIAQNRLDIACVPANLAAVLFNNPNVDVRVLGINTLGVLYIVEQGDSVQSVSDLAGKTIYASGKGATPEYALNYILTAAGLAEQVTLEWLPEHAACVAALSSDPNGIAMLPQPFVTTAQLQNENLRLALDLNTVWDELQAAAEGEPSALITGVVIAQAAFAEENPQALAEFLTDYSDSVTFVNSNIAAGAALVGKYDIVPQAVAEKALPLCKIVLITGEDMKSKLLGYYDVLFTANPESVGGALPEDEFFYIP
jgi:NitT/TauT family transport system substrate-binding protein